MSAGGTTDSRTDLIKRLLIKFKKPQVVSEGTQDFDDFFKLLELNNQLTTPKALSVQVWCLLNETQQKEHKGMGHTVVSAD
jgi:hypothetical protein